MGKHVRFIIIGLVLILFSASCTIPTAQTVEEVTREVEKVVTATATQEVESSPTLPPTPSPTVAPTLTGAAALNSVPVYSAVFQYWDGTDGVRMLSAGDEFHPECAVTSRMGDWKEGWYGRKLPEGSWEFVVAREMVPSESPLSGCEGYPYAEDPFPEGPYISGRTLEKCGLGKVTLAVGALSIDPDRLSVSCGVIESVDSDSTPGHVHVFVGWEEHCIPGRIRYRSQMIRGSFRYVASDCNE